MKNSKIEKYRKDCLICKNTSKISKIFKQIKQISIQDHAISLSSHQSYTYFKNINKYNFCTSTFAFISIFRIDFKRYIPRISSTPCIFINHNSRIQETNLVRLEFRTFPILEQLERGLSLLAAGGDASILYLCNRNGQRPVMQACGRVQWHEETTDVRVLVKSVRIG